MSKDIKPVTGYDGRYLVARDGRVLCTVSRGGALPRRTISPPRELRPVRINTGYRTVVLESNGVRRCWLVHRLVAEVFHGPAPSPDAVVDHKDFNRENNHADNLEWVTQRENVRRCVQAGRRAFQKLPAAA